MVLAEREPLPRQELRDMLLGLCYEIVGEVRDGMSAVQLTQALKPDLVLLSAKLPGIDGVCATKAIAAARLAPVVILSGPEDAQLALEAAAAGAAAYLVRPFSERRLLAAMEVALDRFHAAAALRRRIQTLREEAETERLLRRATALLMDRHGLDAGQAAARIESLAATSRKDVREIAASLLLAARTRP